MLRSGVVLRGKLDRLVVTDDEQEQHAQYEARYADRPETRLPSPALGNESADDDAQDRPIPASEREQAEQAALEETGGGEVTETEVDDEESKYEVEVTLEDGTQVDVQLDEDFQVVGTESDGTDDESGADD